MVASVVNLRLGLGVGSWCRRARFVSFLGVTSQVRESEAEAWFLRFSAFEHLPCNRNTFLEEHDLTLSAPHADMEFMTSLQGGIDDQKPSLFEVLSEQQLNSLIPPSLRYLLAVATHRHPRYLLRVLNSFDELYALLSLLVERYYLKVYGGGFTENFYGLKRERVLRVKGGEVPRAQLGAPSEVRETLKLRNGDIWKNLAIMVGVPYIKRKLDEAYEVHASGVNLLGPSYQDRDRYPTEGTVKQRLLWLYKWFLRKVYPSINAAYYFSLLAFNLAYLFDGSKYHSPWLWMIGSRIRRLNGADHRAIDLATQPKPPPTRPGARPGQTNSIFSRRIMTDTILSGVFGSLKILLPTSIFALKFLEWWYNSDFARQLSRRSNEGLELPPPTVTGLPVPRASSQSNEHREKDQPAKSACWTTDIEYHPPPDTHRHSTSSGHRGDTQHYITLPDLCL
jgi:peroxin-12